MSAVDDITRRTLVQLDRTLAVPGLRPIDRDLLRLHQVQVQSELHQGVSR